MFRIGDFSKMSQVTVKALRHYDEIGLFEPAYVDPVNGYRYYSAVQLADLNRIIVLRDLGFYLEQVAVMQNMPPEQIREMLIERKKQIEKQLAREAEKLRQVESRLEILEREDDILSAYEVVIKKIDPQRIIGKRAVLPTYYHIHELFTAVCDPLRNVKLNFSGSALAIYYDCEYREKDVDVEVAVPVQTSDTEVAGFEVKELPGIDEAACLVHKGSYENLHLAYSTLMKWVEDNAYEIAGPDREVYLTNPDECSNPEDYVTELQLPVRKK